VRHEQAWKLLPDLLEDRDDPELLAHVRDCADCQRQVFLLGRVDRVLRVGASERQPAQARQRRSWRLGVVAATVAVTVVAALLTPFGADPAQVIAIGLVWQTVLYASSLVGALAQLVWNPENAKARAREPGEAAERAS